MRYRIESQQVFSTAAKYVTVNWCTVVKNQDYVKYDCIISDWRSWRKQNLKGSSKSYELDQCGYF